MADGGDTQNDFDWKGSRKKLIDWVPWVGIKDGCGGDKTTKVGAAMADGGDTQNDFDWKGSRMSWTI
jgi:hypothetical protein